LYYSPIITPPSIINQHNRDKTSWKLPENRKVFQKHPGEIGIVSDPPGALTKPPGDSESMGRYSGSLLEKWA
jgi:hypothetical protein